MKLVLTRDDDGWYGLFTGEPYRARCGDWEADNDDDVMVDKISPGDFHSLFGCHSLRKGRKAEVESITIKLKGKK